MDLRKLGAKAKSYKRMQLRGRRGSGWFLDYWISSKFSVDSSPKYA